MKKTTVAFHQHLPFLRQHQISVHQLRETLKQICSDFNKKLEQLDVIFVDDEELLQMNRAFLQHDYYTDIITFDLSDAMDTVHGELYISRDRVIENAALLTSTPSDEILRVCIHGLLHLCGINDKNEEEKLEMRAAENIYILHYKKLDK
jgi:probable rRNA maturation factor